MSGARGYLAPSGVLCEFAREYGAEETLVAAPSCRSGVLLEALVGLVIEGEAQTVGNQVSQCPDEILPSAFLLRNAKIHKLLTRLLIELKAMSLCRRNHSFRVP